MQIDNTGDFVTVFERLKAEAASVHQGRRR